MEMINKIGNLVMINASIVCTHTIHSSIELVSSCNTTTATTTTTTTTTHKNISPAASSNRIV